MNTLITRSLGIASILIVILLSGCKEDTIPTPQPNDNTTPVKTEFELYLNYWNPTGQDPQIQFDPEKTSPEISIDFTKRFAANVIGSQLVDVVIDNVRIVDEEARNYKINEIKAFEYVNSDWFEDTEFRMTYNQIQDLLVYMVLDVSQSLGDDFDDLKIFASDFVSEIFKESPSARVGIIDFATNVNLFNATNRETDLHNYISSLNQGQFTSLYEAMDLAVEKLINTGAESKSLLTFTDGADNNSDTAYNPGSLKYKVLNDLNSVKVVSFTVGLGGRVNVPVMEDLALNGGSSAFPKNSQELKSVFNDFSKTISSVYALTYQRNQQIISEQDKRILKFVIQADLN